MGGFERTKFICDAEDYIFFFRCMEEARAKMWWQEARTYWNLATLAYEEMRSKYHEEI